MNFDGWKKLKFSLHNSVTMLFIEGFKFPADEWAEKIQEQVKQTNKLMEHYEMICEEKKV